MTDHPGKSALAAIMEAAKGATPGPWNVSIDDDGNPLSGRPSVEASAELDCSIVHWDGFVQTHWRSARGDKEIHANARLIAAANPAALASVAAYVAELEARAERAEAALATARDDTIDEVCVFLRDHGSAEGHVIAAIRAMKWRREP
jgi:hypothetical protein